MSDATTAQRKLIGYVSVDSGMLVVVDPGHIYEQSMEGLPEEEKEEAKRDWPSPNPLPKQFPDGFDGVGISGKQLGTGTWGSAIAVRTGLGDGIFPVYREPWRIVIDLDENYWDLEDGEGLRREPDASSERADPAFE